MKAVSHAKPPKGLKFMDIGIAPYSLTEFGRSIPRARITVRPGRTTLSHILTFRLRGHTSETGITTVGKFFPLRWLKRYPLQFPSGKNA